MHGAQCSKIGCGLGAGHAPFKITLKMALYVMYYVVNELISRIFRPKCQFSNFIHSKKHNMKDVERKTWVKLACQYQKMDFI